MKKLLLSAAVALMAGGYAMADVTYDYVERPVDWTITNFDSEEPNEKEGSKQQGLVEFVIDDDFTTFWHTKWAGSKPTCPHFFVIDLGVETTFDAAEFFTRQCAESTTYNGVPRGYQIYTSATDDFATATKENCATYGTPALTGSLSVMKSSSEKVYFDETQHARYVMVVITASTGLGAYVEADNIFAAFAEFDLLVKESTGEEPVVAEWPADGKWYQLKNQQGGGVRENSYLGYYPDVEWTIIPTSADGSTTAKSTATSPLICPAAPFEATSTDAVKDRQLWKFIPNAEGTKYCIVNKAFPNGAISNKSVGNDGTTANTAANNSSRWTYVADRTATPAEVEWFTIANEFGTEGGNPISALTFDNTLAPASCYIGFAGGVQQFQYQRYTTTTEAGCKWEFIEFVEEPVVEPEPPTVEEFTEGLFYVINQADKKYLGYNGYNADTNEEPYACQVDMTNNAFRFYIGTKGTQHYLHIGSGSNGSTTNVNNFSIGDHTPNFLFKVTSTEGGVITAEKVSAFNTTDSYLIVGNSNLNNKNPLGIYALSNESSNETSADYGRLHGYAGTVDGGSLTTSTADGTVFTVTAGSEVIWKFATEIPVVEPEPEPVYYTFASYNRGGYLTADNGALKHIALSTASVWEATEVEGVENGYYFKNYADGSYMTVSGAVTSSEPSIVYVLPNGINDFGISLSRTNPISNSSCIDANNNGNTGCGNYKPLSNDWQGTTWVQNLIELEEGETIEFYIASASIDDMIAALKAKLTKLSASVPGFDDEYAEAISSLDEMTALELFEMFEGDMDAITAYITEWSTGADTAAMQLLNDLDGEYVTLYNVRRGESNLNPYLAYIDGETPAFNSVAENDNYRTVFEVVALDEGRFTLRNVSSDTYFQPISYYYQTNLAPVATVGEAGSFTFTLSEDYVQLFGGVDETYNQNCYYCFDTKGNNLASWIKDHGCDWQLALTDYKEPVVKPEVPAAHASVVVTDGGSNNRRSIRFDDAILGDHSECTPGNIKGDADGRSRIFTYNVWVKPVTEGNVMGITVSNFRDNVGTVRAKIANGKLDFAGREQITDRNGEYNNKTATYYCNDIELNEWVFLSIVADQENHKVSLYKDCVLAADFETDYGIGLLPDDPTQSFYIGDNGFNFEFEQAQVWTKALTPAELKECYSMTAPEVAPEGLVGFFAAENGDHFTNFGTATEIEAYLEKAYDSTQWGWNPIYNKDSNVEIVAVEEGGHTHPIVDVVFNQPVNPNFTMALMQDGVRIEDPLLFSEVSVAHKGFPVEHFNVEANGETTEVADGAAFELEAKTVTIGAVLPKYNVTVAHNAAHVTVEVLNHLGETADAHEHGANATVKVTPLDGFEVKAIKEGEADILASFEVDRTGTQPVYTLNIESLLGHKALTVESGSTTGLDAIGADTEAANCYDVLGRRVAAPSKGLYIINGKKVVVK